MIRGGIRFFKRMRFSAQKSENIVIERKGKVKIYYQRLKLSV